MSGEMEERVANAITSIGPDFNYRGTFDEWKTAIARAAIAAMQEPTEAMIEAGVSPDEAFERPRTGKNGARSFGDATYASFRAMIDAALNSKSCDHER